MRSRRAIAAITYNGKSITTSLGNYQTVFEYTDPASGESDSVLISIADPDREWIGPWFPKKGDAVKATIKFENRDKEGQTKKLSCGTFTIDDIGYSASAGSGNVMQIGGVSAPASDAFSATERTRTWEKATIKKVAQTIADRYKLSLVFDASDVTVATQEQSGITDSAFLSALCGDYGLSLKVYKKKLVIFDREKYKKKKSVATFERTEIDSVSWNTTIAGSYTGGSITYTDSKSGKDVAYKTGKGKRLLKVNVKADNLADAKLKLEAAINNANHSMTTISFSTMGRPDIVSGQCIRIEGFGKINGKYYVDTKVDSLSGSGYVTKISASKVE